MKNNLREFGADNQIACAACHKGWKLVVRRTQHEVIKDAERQILKCTECGDTLERSVGRNGQLVS